MFVSLGRYRLMRPFVFSTVPLCQGACDLQQKFSIPSLDLSIK
jgi:hypothetical protein